MDFYGIHPNVHPDFSKLSAPVLALFGEQDNFIPLETIESLVTAVQDRGGAIATQVYPNAGHAFFNDTRPDAYNWEAAIAAWDRTLKFFQQHL